MAAATSTTAVRMREAESPDADYYLLETLFKPLACVTSSRIAVWVYHSGPTIREVVLSGHAEGRTCASATSILIEAAKQLDERSVEWMLTCGAAHFRLSDELLKDPEALTLSRAIDSPFFVPGSNFSPQTVSAAQRIRESQPILSMMVQALQELSGEKGLVEVTHHDWRTLSEMRERFRKHMGSSPPKLLLPDTTNPSPVADYLPIVPGNSPDGEPFTVHLDGWDFDCPRYQLVADHHLRTVQRELLRDALRRRRTYRGWLKEWMEDWVPRLCLLPPLDATIIKLSVPAADGQLTTSTEQVSVKSFLQDHAQSFLDRSQRWHEELAEYHQQMSYGRATDAQLDAPIRPDRITEIDFERGVSRERAATEDDKPFTTRERLMFQQPQLISSCLLYIRRMNQLIKPYEELRLKRDRKRRQGLSENRKERELWLVDEISRRIVIETMVRGWPSVYLDNKQDREVFDDWAAEYRAHIWALMAKQARKAGVALDIMLEDNIVYDVRFDDDLGCTIQPLMLMDQTTHVQVHSRSVGASVAVPLWTRQTHRGIPEHVQRLGRTNRERARRLVDEARENTRAGNDKPDLAANVLKLALACHPAEAGKLILQEWMHRLGRDTSEEFKRAHLLFNAVELAGRYRYREAGQFAHEYIETEPSPVPDAFVILALAELIPNDDEQAQLRDDLFRFNQLVPQYNKLVEQIKGDISSLRAGSASSLFATFDRAGQVENMERFNWLKTELDRLESRIADARTRSEKEEQKRQQLIEKAIEKPRSVQKEYPALTRAAQRAAQELKETLNTKYMYARNSDAMFRRYGDIHKIVEARALLDILDSLNKIYFQIEHEPNKTRLQSLDEMKQLSKALWLPEEIENDLRNLSEEFGKGEWDKLQALQIQGALREASSICLQRIQDRLNSEIFTAQPLKEIKIIRIHIMHTVEAKYKFALDMLLNAGVAFGGAISQPWTILDDRITDVPEGGKLSFDAQTCTIFIQTPTERLPLLRAKKITAQEIAYIEEIISDPDLVFSLKTYIPLAEALLTVEVPPQREWRLWRDAMREVYRELLTALSSFSFEATLMPEHAPLLSEEGKESVKRMDVLTPRLEPSVDWNWTDPGDWQRLLGPDVQRVHIA
jgi:hypothetical protein